MLMKPGVKVFSSDNQQLGNLSHIVLYPSTKEITHLMVQKGSGADQSILVPVEAVYSADENRVVLNKDLQSLTSGREIRHGGEVALAEAADQATRPGVQPEGTVTIKERARVTTCDGQNMGVIDYFITSENHLQDMFFTKGSLLKRHRLVQAEAISSINDEEIQLSVDADFINSLPEPHAVM